ncbi:MAG: PTS sugar transporter subunit IIA [Spirochaeta sp.]|jgi:PTS system galactitol-specific IIA component|nr:PTS sugar transporter subunit IIA [Spirochaeta sp.]
MNSPALVQFRDMVREDLILTDLSATSRDDALQQMASLLVEQGLCTADFPAAILRREREHPSALPMQGHKIAIPHTDAEHVIDSAILFARLRHPVTFQAMGSPQTRISVRLISMFALREPVLIGDLLETLITAYQDNELLTRLLCVPSRREIFSLLHRAVDGEGR